MKSKEAIDQQLVLAQIELDRITEKVPVGSGAWSTQKGYINALEWVLDLE